MSSKKVVYVVYYSMYGHVQILAREILKGLEISGVDSKLYQIAETLPKDILNKMNAPEKAKDVPIIQANELGLADGILFGFPTRFGMIPAQVKTLFDSCGRLWQSNILHGKFVGTFFSTGSLGSGQETTTLSCIPFFAHLGLIYVPIGYKHKGITNLNEIHGGSAYGCGTIAGSDGTRKPSNLELDMAKFQGYEFGLLMNKIKDTISQKTSNKNEFF